jgi:hypothetical protein
MKTKESILYFTVNLTTEGTKVVHLTQSKIKNKDNIEDDELTRSFAKSQKNLENAVEGTQVEVGLKGFGISFIDNKPQELLYMCIDEIDIFFKTTTSNLEDDLKDFTENKIEFMMDIGNFQIDNLTNEELPVVLGAKDYYDKKIYVAGQHLYDVHMRNKLSTAFRSVEQEDLKERERDKHGKVLERLPFLRTNFLMNKKTQENKLGAIVRYESIFFGMQELFI